MPFKLTLKCLRFLDKMIMSIFILKYIKEKFQWHQYIALSDFLYIHIKSKLLDCIFFVTSNISNICIEIGVCCTRHYYLTFIH